MGITGVYYTEQNNLQDILTGGGHQPALDLDKTWSLIAGMYPEIPLVPSGKAYKVASDALYGSFYLPAAKVAEIAALVPQLRQREQIEERIDFERWKSLSQGDVDLDSLDEREHLLLMFPMTNNDTYEELVEGYLLPHLQSLFDLFEESAAQGHGLVFMIV